MQRCLKQPLSPSSPGPAKLDQASLPGRSKPTLHPSNEPCVLEGQHLSEREDNAETAAMFTTNGRRRPRTPRLRLPRYPTRRSRRFAEGTRPRQKKQAARTPVAQAHLSTTNALTVAWPLGAVPHQEATSLQASPQPEPREPHSREAPEVHTPSSFMHKNNFTGLQA